MYRKIASRHLRSFQLSGRNKHAQRLFSAPIIQQIRKTFDRRSWPLFEFYLDLYDQITVGESFDGPTLDDKFRNAMRQVIRSKDRIKRLPPSPLVINQMMGMRSALLSSLRRVLSSMDQIDDKGNIKGSLRTNLRRFLDLYIPILKEFSRDKDIYFQEQFKKAGRGSFLWPHFKRMAPKKEQEERLRDVDPEAHQAIQNRRRLNQEVKDNIRESILAEGWTYSSRPIYLGKGSRKRLVHIGKDPATQEEYVYDPYSEEARGLPLDQYIEEQEAKEEEADRLKKAGRKKGKVSRYSEKVMQEKIRKLQVPGWSEIMWEALPGEVEFVAMTDDISKQNRLTRVFPTKMLMGKQIIVEGRYAGVYVDDVINDNGRMMEGNNYAYDEKLKRPVRVDPGVREPFVTVSEVEEDGVLVQKLYMRVPGKSEYTQIRNNLKRVANGVPSMEVLPDFTENPNAKRPRAIKVYFDPKDFSLIKRLTKSLSLSTEALKIIRAYLHDLAKAEVATHKENLQFYTAEQLGGFKEELDHPVAGRIPMQLNTPQKKALAWMDANENSGVCALGTGVGKTTFTLASMQKLIRDGYTEDDSTNGRFLYVAPPGLVGNLDKEADVFLEEESREFLRSRLDAISYQEFQRGYFQQEVPKSLRSVLGEGYWNPEQYIAIFFDEAQALKNLTTKASQAAFQIHHPRKICLTASPMDKDPTDAFVLSAICNNLDLTAAGEIGYENRSAIRKFRERFCKVVGGRIVGFVDDDPETMRDMDIWVRENVFFADKTSVEERPLPTLTPVTMPISMDPGTEEIYREVSGEITSYIRNVHRMLTTKEEKRGDKDWWKLVGRKFYQVIKLLNGLANYPEKTLHRLADMMRENMQDVHPALQKLVRKLKKKHSVTDLREKASSAVSVKMERAYELSRERLERGGKILLFSDDKEMVFDTAIQMSSKMGGLHAACFGNAIRVFRGGEELSELSFPVVSTFGGEMLSTEDKKRNRRSWTGRTQAPNHDIHELPFTKRKIRKYPSLPEHKKVNPETSPSKWHKFVLDHFIQNHRIGFQTCSLEGKVFATGQNLQVFDMVIHLDRNNWSSEEMQQRTARSWRQGQKNPVTEVTIDAVYDTPYEETDPTLDEIRKLYQEMSADVFDRLIKESQKTDISQDHYEMMPRQSSYWGLDERNMFLALSPMRKILETPRKKK